MNTFNDIAKNNKWGDKESISGPGSNNEQTKVIKEQIPLLIAKYQITTMFDVPCGDFNWMQHIVDKIPNYIGGDCVNDIIVSNDKKYNQQFVHFDIVTDPIPSDVDMIFCRDLLVHFPKSLIIKVLQKIKDSNVKYLLMTTFINRQFSDINIGSWRPISFFNPPFNFPQPLELINENCTEGYPKFMDKCLGLWLVSDIPHLN